MRRFVDVVHDVNCNYPLLPTVVSTPRSNESGKVVKSKSNGTSKTGAKVAKVAVKAHKPSIASVLLTVSAPPMPTIARRQGFEKVHSFPQFDKNDSSLLYFPTAYTKHMTSGDISAMSSLISSHFDKNCSIAYRYLSPHALTPKTLLSLLQVISDLRPDMIMCVNSTEVIENQIVASILLKCTDSKVMFDALASRVQSQTPFPQFLGSTREEALKERIMRRAWPEAEKQRLIGLAEAGLDFVKHVNMQMTLTVDPATKKVVDMKMIGKITSLQVVLPEII